MSNRNRRTERWHANEREETEGYTGLYNFRHHFWVAKGSRVYPPVPQISLNMAQSLAADLGNV
jgi:hypothetical protein